MKSLAGIAALAAIVLGAGTARAEQRSYDVPSFDAVRVSTGISVVVTVGGSQSVSAEAPNTAALDRLQVSVHDGRLELDLGDNIVGRLLTLGLQPPITVHVAAPTLKSAEASSGANLDIDGMTGDALSLSAASGAAVVARLGSADGVNLDASSGGTLKVSGACAHLIASAASGGNLEARDLACGEVNASASSGAHATVNATSSVNAHASLGGSLEVAGKPTKVSSESGMGGSVRISD